MKKLLLLSALLIFACSSDDSENIDGIVINKKGEFKKFFISRGDYKFLEKSINKSIESLIEENNW